MSVEFPAMRADVIDALTSLADRAHQEQNWGRFAEGDSRYDDLTLNVHLLYDDCRVLPDPAGEVGAVLYPDDVPLLEQLGTILGALIDDHGESADAVYLADSRWPDVVEAARSALKSMRTRS